MVIGGIGYCGIQGNFQFHRNIVEGLQIYNGSLLFGIYHPEPKGGIDTSKMSKNAIENMGYHFMLTPIPDKVWPRTARYIMRLRNFDDDMNPIDAHTLGIEKISQFLAQHGVAIIYSFSNPSAHRYSTWDIHVCFDKILKEEIKYKEKIEELETLKKLDKIKKLEKKPNNKKTKVEESEYDKMLRNYDYTQLKDLTNESLSSSYDKENSYYREVFFMTKAIESLIKRNFAQLLFSDQQDVDLIKSIVSRVNTSCHFFYHESQELQKKNKENKIAYTPFQVRYNNGIFTPIKLGIINQVIRKVKETKDSDLNKTGNDFQLPSICFAEADSHYLNLRLIIVPKNKKYQFFKLSVFHERDSNKPNENNTSRGLLNFISSQFAAPYYKIWKSSSLIFEHRDDESESESYCNGKWSFFIQVMHSVPEQRSKSERDTIQGILDSMEFPGSANPKLKDIRLKGKCESIFPQLLQRYFKIEEQKKLDEDEHFVVHRKFKRDIFISHATEDAIGEKSIVAQLVKIFEANHCNVSIIDNTSMNTGIESLSEDVLKKIRTSREFCILFTKNSLGRPWVTTEWGAAWALGIKIKPIRVGLTHPELITSLPDPRIVMWKSIEWKHGDDAPMHDYAKSVYRRRGQSMLEQEDYDYNSSE